MTTLRDSIEPHRPNPLSSEVEAASRANGNNVNCEADIAAVLAAPAIDLPPAIRAARAEIERAEAARAKADEKLQAALQRQYAYQEIVREIGERRQRLQGQIARLSNAQAEIGNASANVKFALLNERHAGPQPLVAMLQSLVLAREVASLLPALIEEEQAEIDRLDAKAAKLAAECEC